MSFRSDNIDVDQDLSYQRAERMRRAAEVAVESSLHKNRISVHYAQKADVRGVQYLEHDRQYLLSQLGEGSFFVDDEGPDRLNNDAIKENESPLSVKYDDSIAQKPVSNLLTVPQCKGEDCVVLQEPVKEMLDSSVGTKDASNSKSLPRVVQDAGVVSTQDSGNKQSAVCLSSTVGSDELNTPIQTKFFHSAEKKALEVSSALKNDKQERKEKISELPVPALVCQSALPNLLSSAAVASGARTNYVSTNPNSSVSVTKNAGATKNKVRELPENFYLQTDLHEVSSEETACVSDAFSLELEDKDLGERSKTFSTRQEVVLQMDQEAPQEISSAVDPMSATLLPETQISTGTSQVLVQEKESSDLLGRTDDYVPSPFDLPKAVHFVHVSKMDWSAYLADLDALIEQLSGSIQLVSSLEGESVELPLQKIFPGASVKLSWEKGFCLVCFTCSSETSRDIFIHNLEWFSARLAERLSNNVDVRVVTDDPDYPFLQKVLAYPPAFPSASA